MSYRDVPNHGRASVMPPGKASKQINIYLQGGPRDGDLLRYGQPLPKVLVVHGETGWKDYFRKPNSTTYIYQAGDVDGA